MVDATAHDPSDAHTEYLPVKGRKIPFTGGTTGISRAMAVLLTQPRRCALSLMRVETRLNHP